MTVIFTLRHMFLSQRVFTGCPSSQKNFIDESPPNLRKLLHRDGTGSGNVDARLSKILQRMKYRLVPPKGTTTTFVVMLTLGSGKQMVDVEGRIFVRQTARFLLRSHQVTPQCGVAR